jgi:hypothetical protein
MPVTDVSGQLGHLGRSVSQREINAMQVVFSIDSDLVWMKNRVKVKAHKVWFTILSDIFRGR